MPEDQPPSREVVDTCTTLNTLWRELGEAAADDPLFQSLLRRLLLLAPATETDRHVRMAVDMGVLPRPHALTLDGAPLFTVGQLARLFALDLGVLAPSHAPDSGAPQST